MCYSAFLLFMFCMEQKGQSRKRKEGEGGSNKGKEWRGRKRPERKQCDGYAQSLSGNGKSQEKDAP